jgi:hypothetical protein
MSAKRQTFLISALNELLKVTTVVIIEVALTVVAFEVVKHKSLAVELATSHGLPVDV